MEKALEIENKLKALIQTERKINREILEMLLEADRENVHLRRGYGSLFDWLTKCLGYSESAAQRRIQAMRLLKSVPEISNKISSGEVNLTTLSKTQSVLKQHEKTSGIKLSNKEKMEVLEKIENKNSKETEKVLFQLFPQASQDLQKERVRFINSDEAKVALILPEKTLKDLEAIKHKLSHKFPHSDTADIISFLAQRYLEQEQIKTERLLQKDQKKAEKTLNQNKDENSHDRNSRASAPRANETMDLQTANSSTKNTATTKHCGTNASKKTANVQNLKHKPEAQGPGMARVEGLHGWTDLLSPITAVKPERLAIRLSTKRSVLHKANYRCEFTDPIDQTRCESTYQLEIDHIFPVSHGGKNELGNFRCFCRAHNQVRNK